MNSAMPWCCLSEGMRVCVLLAHHGRRGRVGGADSATQVAAPTELPELAMPTELPELAMPTELPELAMPTEGARCRRSRCPLPLRHRIRPRHRPRPPRRSTTRVRHRAL